MEEIKKETELNDASLDNVSGGWERPTPTNKLPKGCNGKKISDSVRGALRGIMYKTGEGDTLESLKNAFEINDDDYSAMLNINNITDGTVLSPNTLLFVPTTKYYLF